MSGADERLKSEAVRRYEESKAAPAEVEERGGGYQGRNRIAARYHVGGVYALAVGGGSDLGGVFGTKVAAMEAARRYLKPDGFVRCEVWDTMARGGRPVLVFTTELRDDGGRVETSGTVLRIEQRADGARVEWRGSTLRRQLAREEPQDNGDGSRREGWTS